MSAKPIEEASTEEIFEQIRMMDEYIEKYIDNHPANRKVLITNLALPPKGKSTIMEQKSITELIKGVQDWAREN